jgi:hypothetical protein
MKEYRDRSKTCDELASSSSSQPSSSRPEKWQTLDQQYGLEDMYELEGEVDTQTLEQEYQSYVTAALSKPTTILVKYWDVCTSMFVLLTIDRTMLLL